MKNVKALGEEDFFATLENQPHDKTLSQLQVADRMFMSMIEGVIITDTKGHIRFMNPAYSKITGYGDEIIGLNPRILQSGRHDRHFYRQMWKSIADKGQWKGEIWNRRKNGELYIQSTTISRIDDDAGKPLFYASVITDITEQKIVEQRLQDDLLLAREVQKTSLSKPFKDDFIHIAGVYLPSDVLGGDMYAWYQIDEGRYGIFLMDVMGHGVASSLICMSIRSLLRGIITKCKEPDIVLQELNNHMYSLFRDEDAIQMKSHYLTCIYILVDTKNQVIKHASAGHLPGFLLKKGQDIIELDAGTVPLGLLKDIEVQVGVHAYEYGDIKIVLYTDGICEDAKQSPRESIERFKQLVLQYRDLEVQKFLKRVIAHSLRESELSKFQDDASLVAITIY